MSQQQKRSINPKVWRACAGTSVQIPALHSRVYYFPQGHFEQAISTPHYLSPLLLSRPCIPCRLSAVDLLAHPGSDEVYAKLLLNPITDYHATPHQLNHTHDSLEVPDGDKIVSFAKILTPSDANNGGGFSVPRYCADSIFPPLNFKADPPVQTLSMTDVQGVIWEFRHIYRGTPRRHLLTTGWSKFVNNKMLVAGDSVVFMKNSCGKMFVGIRRAVRGEKPGKSGGDCDRSCSQVGGSRMKIEETQQEEDNAGFGGEEGSWSKWTGKLNTKLVAAAAELAAQNLPFEVVYFPRSGSSDFVVNAEVVEKALNVAWAPRMRVKMSMETEDSSRMTWFQGVVSSVSAPGNGPWRASPWRMLEVTWDEPEVLQNAQQVSPWQVELVSNTPPHHTAFYPAKRFRAAQGSGLPTDGEGDSLFRMTGFTNSAMGHFNQPLLNYDTFPDGMQGARHDLFSVSSFSNFLSNNSHLCTGDSFGNCILPKLKTVSTELNIGSSQSENLSSDSQSSLHSGGAEFVGTQICNSTKPATGSIQLFGKIIQMEQPVESGLHGTGFTANEGNKDCDQTEGIDNPLGHSLTYSNLLDRLDVNCQRASNVEACYL